MTTLCGMAQNVAMLAAARVGVGIGESAGTPASQSLISDLFPKGERPRALGIFAMGRYIGVFLGYFFGGWVNQYYGWRIAFLAAGLPGLLLALMLRLAVGERGHQWLRRPLEALGARVHVGACGPRLRFLSLRGFLPPLRGDAGRVLLACWLPPRPNFRRCPIRVQARHARICGCHGATYGDMLRPRGRSAHRRRGQ
jgi:MFS family permease